MSVGFLQLIRRSSLRMLQASFTIRSQLFLGGGYVAELSKRDHLLYRPHHNPGRGGSTSVASREQEVPLLLRRYQHLSSHLWLLCQLHWPSVKFPLLRLLTKLPETLWQGGWQVPGGSERFGSLSLQRILPDCAAEAKGYKLGL